MPLPLTIGTIVATYHHARQSDLDPTPAELQGWSMILQANYGTILPAQMTAHGLDPGNPLLIDLSLLLSELTHANGVLTRARRGCAVVAGLLRAGTVLSDAVPLGDALPAGPAPRRATRSRAAARKPRKRTKRTARRRTTK